MRFCEIVVRFTSPVILTLRRTERGYLSPPSYIPATTMRGAIISSLYYLEILGEESLKSEAHSPRIFASPAYPMIESRKSYPCHPFAYKCKISHDGKWEKKIYAYEVIDSLERDEPPEFKHECSRGHVASLEEIHPNPIIPMAESFEEVSLVYEHVRCVGMSGARAASRRQLLYTYEAIASGQEFWFRLAAPSEVAEKLEKGIELRIGRGISRGFGRAKMVKVTDTPIEELAEKIRQEFSDKRFIALYSLSHLIAVDEREDCILEINLKEIGERCGITASGRLLVKRIYGRRRSLQPGWDMRRGRRPVISPAWKPGSVAVAELRELGDKWETALAILASVGELKNVLDEEGKVWPIPGFNLMEPLRLNPTLGEKK